MKIDYFKINGFGKLSNKEIELKDNINIIYGKKESGKSTILKFISGMFYGISKNKNGKDISDFDKYNPWKTDEFSGKIKYTLDNKETFEIYREFKKKSPVIYNENMQDISKDFKVDKTRGIDFFSEQTGIDEEIFNSTAIIEQEGVRLNKSSQNNIIQKISNVVSSGDETISFKKTIDRINKEQTEKVGTDRTSQRPINIINERLDNLEKEKSELEIYSSQISISNQRLEELKKSLEDEECKLQLLKNIKENIEKNKIKEAEINVNKKLINDYEEKIIELSNKVDKNVKTNIKHEKKNCIMFYILIIISVFASIILFFINKLFSIIIFLLGIILGCVCAISVSKFKKEKKSKLIEIDSLEQKINHEIEILKKNQEEQQNQILKKQEEYDFEINKANEIIKNKYIDMIDINFIKMALVMNFEEVLVAITNKENRINSLKFNLQSNQIEIDNMNEKLNNLASLEEEITNLKEEKEELIKLNNSFNIAKECMELAYEKIRNNVSPKFTNNLSNIINRISNGKYSKINFNDQEGLTVETDSGNYVSAERLSTGTIDQMYLSLRLSTIEEMSKEKMPIILDETFAYFDNMRLSNILKYINENFKENQIIIFTCSDREKIALDNLNISYNLITLENQGTI